MRPGALSPWPSRLLNLVSRGSAAAGLPEATAPPGYRGLQQCRVAQVLPQTQLIPHPIPPNAAHQRQLQLTLLQHFTPVRQWASDAGCTLKGMAQEGERDATMAEGEEGTASGPAGTEPTAEPQQPQGGEVREGQARIKQQGNAVFYNVAQVTNRDLSVAVLQQFVRLKATEAAEGGGAKGKRARPQKGAAAPPEGVEAVEGVRVLEALSATGLRSIRYALEVDGLGRVDANDMDATAVKSIESNISLNGERAVRLVRAHQSDARLLMMQRPLTYDAVDLDPYGSPSQLVDGALQTLTEGGLLLVTATDMAVLCGNNGEVCWTKYGSYPIHRPYCHEMAVRILLACLSSRAAVYGRYIVPLLSLSLDFYVRVFVRVFTSAALKKEAAARLAYLWQSSGCDAFQLQRVGGKTLKNGQPKFTPGHGPVVPQKCPFTGSGHLLGGPIWAEPIHDTGFVKAVLADMEARKQCFAQFPRIRGVLTTVLEELPDVPLYFSLHEICKTVRCTPPKASVIRSAIINAGYRVSSTHANPLGVKTDAPWHIIWDIIRCWVRQHPVKAHAPKSYAHALLSKEPEHVANFSHVGGSVSKAKAEGVSRFVQNPPNWGPKARHGRSHTGAKPPAAGGPNGSTDPPADEGSNGGDAADADKDVDAAAPAPAEAAPGHEAGAEAGEKLGEGGEQGAGDGAGVEGTAKRLAADTDTAETEPAAKRQCT